MVRWLAHWFIRTYLPQFAAQIAGAQGLLWLFGCYDQASAFIAQNRGFAIFCTAVHFLAYLLGALLSINRERLKVRADKDLRDG